MTQAWVAVTGAAGRLGRAACAGIRERGFRVRGFDRRAYDGAHEMIVGELSDPAAIARTMKGAKALIHLAATPDDAPVLEDLVPNNIVGLYHVLEAARAAGIRRVVLASSGQMNWWQNQRGPWPVRVTDPVSPKLWYAATKAFLEAIGRGYAEQYGLSIIAARLGWCPRDPEHAKELDGSGFGPDVYLSQGDAGRFFGLAVDGAPEIGFATVFVHSRPKKRFRFDLGPARALLGYEPQDTWPEGCTFP